MHAPDSTPTPFPDSSPTPVTEMEGWQSIARRCEVLAIRADANRVRFSYVLSDDFDLDKAAECSHWGEQLRHLHGEVRAWREQTDTVIAVQRARATMVLRDAERALRQLDDRRG